MGDSQDQMGNMQGQSQKGVRVVLMHPPLRNVLGAATPEYVDENRGHTPPLGLLYVQAAVEQSAHSAVFLDADLEGWDHEHAAREALRHGPDLVGLQAMTFTIRDAILVARAIKRLDPRVATLIGGPHPTIFPEETAALEGVDFALAGEGELAFVQFLDAFADPEARVRVPGIAAKRDGGVSFTPTAGLLKNLDAVPYPARKSSPYQRYSSVLAERSPITTMITSRGCPFQCVFCNRMGRRYRAHSARYVLDEMEQIHALGIPEIFVHDDTFSLNRDRVAEICRGMLARGFDFVWEARTRVDCVDEELLALMRSAGCHRLSFGVESGSPRVLKSMRKGTDLDQVRRVFAWCRKLGIVTLADFMIGNLDEEREDIAQSLRLVREINPDYVQYSICSPYPGTPLYQIGRERGLIPRDIWREFARDPLREGFECPVWTQHFSREELERLTARAYRAFYMRPAFVARQLRRLRSWEQLRTMLRAACGMLRWRRRTTDSRTAGAEGHGGGQA